MNQTSIKIILLILLFNLAQSETCFAPLGNLGPICAIEYSFSGKKASFVNYHIQVVEPEAKVFCTGLGASVYLSDQECKWGFQNLGLVSNGYISVIWDSNSKSPAIQCYAAGKSTEIIWRVTTGVGRLTCQGKKNHNKLLAGNSVEMIIE